MKPAIAAMLPRHGLRESDPYRLRLAVAGLFSLLIHAFILSLEFGIPGLGLPGLQAPWEERRAEVLPLHLQLAQTNNPAPVPAEPGPATAQTGLASHATTGSNAPLGNNASILAADAAAVPQPSPSAAPASLHVLPPAPSRPASGKPDARAPRQSARHAKPPAKMAKSKRRTTRLAARRAARRLAKQSSPPLLALADKESESFSVPPTPENASTEGGAPDAAASEEMPPTPAQAVTASEAATEQEPLDAVPTSEAQAAHPDPEPEPTAQDVTPPAEPTPTQADLLAQQQEEENARRAEQLAAQRQAEDEARQQALEQERLMQAEAEARRLAEQERQAQAAREAQQLADQQAQEAARRAEMDAQRQAEQRLAQQQEAQRMEEEARRRQQLEAQLAAQKQAEEDAQRALAAEAQERAAREEAARELQAAAEQHARELAMQEQAAAAARQARQAAMEQERAQALAAQTREPGAALPGGALESGSSESRGASTGSESTASGGSQGDRAGARGTSAQSPAPAQAQAAAAPAAKTPPAPQQNDEDNGPMLLTDGQLDSIKVAQIRTVDKTRLETWEVRQLEQDAPSARRRTLFGRVHDDIVLKMYVDDWEKRVERDSDAKATQALSTSARTALVTVSLRSDGSIEQVVIERSSGHAELDEAVKGIAARAAPKPFPRDLARRFDVIEVRRAWDFSEGLRLRDAGR